MLAKHCNKQTLHMLASAGSYHGAFSVMRMLFNSAALPGPGVLLWSSRSCLYALRICTPLYVNRHLLTVWLGWQGCAPCYLRHQQHYLRKFSHFTVVMHLFVASEINSCMVVAVRM
jgi:hypothetical protein